MIFDQPPAELPRATLRPREGKMRLWLDARAWLVSKWRWLRPRAIPCATAAVGLVGVLASASYLRELAVRVPDRVAARAAAEANEQVERRGLGACRVGTKLTFDGQPWMVAGCRGDVVQLAPIKPVHARPAAR